MFRLDLKTGDNYETVRKLKTLLNRAKKILQENSPIYFDYTLEKKGGSKTANWINFKVITKEKPASKTERTEMWQLVWEVLCFPYPSLENGKAMDIADKIADHPEKMEAVYKRFKKLKNEYDTLDKDFEDVVRIVKYILKEDYSDVV